MHAVKLYIEQCIVHESCIPPLLKQLFKTIKFIQ